jgi:hypothetical protein
MGSNRRMFKPDDDDELRHLDYTLGEANRADIAVRMSTPFTARQCRERWRNYLSPELEHDEWTEEDDRKLLRGFEHFGTRWTLIAETFSGRSGNTIRNRYFLLQRRNQRCAPGEIASAATAPPPARWATMPGPADLIPAGAAAPFPHRDRFPGLDRPTTLLPLPPAPHEIPRPGVLAFHSTTPPAGFAWFG